MSFLNRLFGSRDASDGEGELESRLQKLEAEAQNARPGYVGTALNRAGDVALRSELRDRAAAYYGRAIDAFLEDGQREAARGVANKIIRVRPGAARTLCTLIWLDLGARHSATALLHLRDYLEAAKNVDKQALAADQIYSMARIVPDSEFIQAAADALDILDRSEQAEEVRRWVSTQGSPDVVRDPYELADACLRAAVKSNESSSRRPESRPSTGAKAAPATDAAPDTEAGPAAEAAPDREEGPTTEAAALVEADTERPAEHPADTAPGEAVPSTDVEPSAGADSSADIEAAARDEDAAERMAAPSDAAGDAGADPQADRSKGSKGKKKGRKKYRWE